MATVFERLDDQMKKLTKIIEEMRSSIQENTDILKNLKSEINSAFLSFSDMIGKRFDELEEKTQQMEPIPSKTIEVPSINLENFNRDMNKVISEIKNMLETAAESMRQIKNAPMKTIPEAIPIITPIKPISTTLKPVSTTSKPSQKIKETSADLLPPSKRAPVPIKVGQTVPIEVVNLLDSLKTRIEYPAVEFADVMEQIRDEIVRIYKFHPTLYELGTFARKLKKYPQNMKIDPDVVSLLFDKIEEWKKRISGL